MLFRAPSVFRQALATVIFIGSAGVVSALDFRAGVVAPVPFSEGMLAMAPGSGCSVAVGRAGAIYSSANGTEWGRRETSLRVDLAAVAWTGTVFCAVGDGGAVVTSPDGATWTPRTSGTTINLGAAAAGNGQIVIAGDAGKIFTSPDGAAWTARTSPVLDRINGLAFGNGLFVAVTEAGGVLTSADAVTWTSRASAATGALSSAAFGSGLFVIAGAGGEILTSPDGITWTLRRSGQPERLWCVSPTSAGFAACGSGGVVAVSADGTSWTPQTILGGPRLRAISQAGPGLIALSDTGGVWVSAEGSTWTSPSTASTANLSAAATDGATVFVAVGTGGTILTSPDGSLWAAASAPTGDDLQGVTFGGSKFVAVGANGTIIASATGASWVSLASGTTTRLDAVTHGMGGFVAVGQAGLILHSPDGSAWTPHNVAGAKGDWLGVAFGNGLYVAVGQWGQIATSPDGAAWTLLPDDPSARERWYDITGIAFANGRFVTSTHYATSFSSTDGSTWTKRAAAMVPGKDFHGVLAIDGGFVVFGDGGTIQTSPDGVAWSDVIRASGARLRGAAQRGNIAIFVGDGGAILQAALMDRRTTWTSYHDTITQADDSANVTMGNATSDTALKDFATALPTGVTIRFTQTIGTSGGVKTDATSGNPILGGDASAIFGGIIGFGSNVIDLGKIAGTATLTISGLSPGKIYDLSIFGTRDNFASQTKLALAGAASFTSAHSAGSLAIGGTPAGAEVSIATGDGSTVAGRVARWSDLITTGTTLTVTVTSPDPAAYSCILPQAIRLMEMTEAPALLAGPAPADAEAGSPLTLSSRVVGTGVAYQWYRRDKTGTVTPVDGATGVNLTLPSLDASAQYSLRATASGGTVDSAWATVIARRTFAAWAAIEGVPPDSGTLDPDGDGVPNLVEFALGTDPLVADAADAPALSVSPSDRLVLAFRKSREAAGILLVPETSSTLAAGSWESAPVLEQQTGEADFATETREASVPLTSSRTFLRLRVSPP